MKQRAIEKHHLRVTRQVIHTLLFVISDHTEMKQSPYKLFSTIPQK